MYIEPLQEVPEALQPYAGTTLSNTVIHGLGRCPDALKGWFDFYWTLTRSDGHVPVETKELIRHQIAGLYGCPLCTSFLVPAVAERPISLEKAQAVLNPSNPIFTEAERVMLDFTHNLGPPHVAPSDFDAMRQHYSEVQITEIGFLAAMFTGWGRLTFGFRVVTPQDAACDIVPGAFDTPGVEQVLARA